MKRATHILAIQSLKLGRYNLEEVLEHVLLLYRL